MINVKKFSVEGKEEVIEKRDYFSKTYREKDKSFTLVRDLSLVHYKDENNQFKEIDLTLLEETDHFFCNKTIYDVKIFKNFIGYQYKSKEKGRVDVKLREINGVDISKIDLNIDLQKVHNFENRVIYKEVVPGLDLFFNLRGGRVQLFKVLNNSNAPVSFTWDIFEDHKKKCSFIKKTRGQDKDKNEIDLSNEIKEIEKEKVSLETKNKFSYYQFKEKFNNRIKIKDRKTRIKSWSKDFKYPVVIDADVTEDIITGNDDGMEKIFAYIGGDKWYSVNPIFSTCLLFSHGYYPGFGSLTHHAGFRFQSLGISQGATINTAFLKIKIFEVNSATNVRGKLYGDDVDSAAAWSDSSLPSGISKTSASKAVSFTTTGTSSISVTNIVQEIISRPGWAGGNMRFAMLNTNTEAVISNFARIRDYNADPGDAAQLIINYDAGTEYYKTCSEEFSTTGVITKSMTRGLAQEFSMNAAITKETDRTVSENLSLSDAYSKIWSLAREYSENFSLSDGDLKNVARTFSENFSMGESILKEIQREILESYSLSDSVLKSISRTLLESLSFSDAIEILKQFVKELTESFGLTDNYSRVLTAVRTLSEYYSLTDAITKSITRTITEEFSFLSEGSGVKGTFKELTEALSLTDAKIFSIGKSLSENMTLSDGDVYFINRIFSENLGISESLLKQTEKEFSEEISLEASRDLLMIKSLAEAYGLSDQLLRSLARTLTENPSLTDNVYKEMQRELTEGLTISEEMDLLIRKNLSESYSLSEQITKEIAKALTEEISLSDGDTKQFYRTFLESMSIADEYSRNWNVSRTFSESMTLTDIKSFERTIELLETLSLSDGDAVMNYIKVLSESFDLDDKFIKMVTSWAASDTIRTDIQDIIQEEGIEATLIRQAETTDGQGAITGVSETSYTIYMAAQDILRSDRQMRDMGLALPGTERIFLFHSYPDSITGNGTLVPQVGDLIVDDESIYWRIEEISAEREMEGSEIFKSAIIKKVDLTQ